MENKKYASLHNHSHFSNASCGFPDSINKVNNIIDLALELGLSAFALTDHECVSGHVSALNYIKDLKSKAKSKNDEEMLNKLNNFRLILGNEIYLAREDLTKQTYKKGEQFRHMILLAKNRAGQKQLRKLSSKAWERSFFFAIQRRYNIPSDLITEIQNNKGNIIATTACLGGPLGNYFFNFERKEAIQLTDNFCSMMCEIFGYEDFYIELAPSSNEEQIEYNKFLYNNFHNKYKFTIATDSHFGKKEDFNILKTYLNSKSSKDREVESFYKYSYMMTWEEIEKLCSYFPVEFLEEMRNNTLEIAAKCEDYNIDVSPIIPYIPIAEQDVVKSFNPEMFDNYSSIKNYLTSEHLSDRHLIWKILKGFQIKNVEINDITLSRINLELEELWGISDALNQRMSNYLITMAKIIDVIWEDADAVIGVSRGSAGSWLINYLLGITQWNPLEYPIKIEHWRFLHKSRPDLPDIDIDTAGNKRQDVIMAVDRYFKSIGGNIVQVCTYGTEKSKAAIRTACRGLNIEDESALYISSLIPAERGQTLTLKQCYYGDEDHQPIKQFVEAMNNFPKLWDVASRLEGLITSLGAHASGVILTNEDITENNSIMKTSTGLTVTAYDLHESEQLGCVKYDFLSVDAIGKIHTCLNYLLQDGVIEWKGSLRETYDYYISPSKLVYNSELWYNVAENNINSLFQLNTAVGTQALSAIHATSLHEVGIINSLMRLQPQNKGDEQPIETYRKYKENIQEWYSEMRSFGLNSEEIKIMEEHLLVLNGISDTQESVMMMTMDPRISGFSVQEANKLRKGIAKKSEKAQAEAYALFYSKGEQCGTSKQLLDYVWKVQIARQLGYSFSLPHVAGYSMIAMQEAHLYTNYPSIYWNVACLSDTAGGDVTEDFADLIAKGYVKIPLTKEKVIKSDEDYLLDLTEEELSTMTNEQIQDYVDKAKAEEVEEEESSKKNTSIKRGKIAAAIGEFQKQMDIDPPLITSSGYGFKPDIKTNSIICGLKVVSKIGDKLINEIINNRPYVSFDDFIERVNISKDRVVALIKADAFRDIDNRDRLTLLKEFVLGVSNLKSKLTLQNLNALIENNLIPKEQFEMQIKIFHWVKYIRKNRTADKLQYKLDDRAYAFYTAVLDEKYLYYGDGFKLVSASYVDSFYKNEMNKIKNYISANHQMLLDKYNNILFQEQWRKYKMDYTQEGEMQSMRFYINGHPLNNISIQEVTITPLNEIEEEKQDGTFFINGQFIPKYEIYHIIGTVIDKNKLKSTVTVLTPQGPIDVKVWKNTFAHYDKAIVRFEGEEKVIVQDSFFEKGTYVLLTGILRGNTFTLKKYKSTNVDDVLLKIHYNQEYNSYALESKLTLDDEAAING